MTGTYDLSLVSLSYVVAALAAYVALTLASRVSASQGRGATYWLIGGAVSMGSGIWSMHFIGMLAFRLPIPMSYEMDITLLSMVIAMLVSGFALFTINRSRLTVRRLLVSGALMGTGIAAMHYTGMAAIPMSPPIRWDPLLYGASIAIAIAASVVALWIAFNLRSEALSNVALKRFGAALVMGVAIAGMHYTGMAAAHFSPDSVCLGSPQGVSNLWLATTIGGCTMLFLAATMLISVFDARIASNTARLAESLRLANEQLTGEIVERRRAEEAQRASAAELKLITDQMPAMLAYFDAELVYRYHNRGFEQWTGLPAAQIDGRHLADVIGAEACSEIASRIPQARAEGRIFFESSRRMPDGRQQHAETTLMPRFDDAGAVIGYYTMITDISERKQMAALQIAIEAAQAASRAKSDFLATMSHEIRTPMNGVLGMTDLLMDSGLTPTQRRYAQTIRNSGDALLNIINDILDFSKIEAGKLELENIDFSVREVAEEVAELLTSRAHTKGLELACQVDDDVPLVLGGDPGRLRQVLLNLGGNAVKFTESGEVLITVKRAADDRATPGNTVLRFAVRDTGIGITQETRGRLFQAFSQADGSTTRRFGGTGLGLVICKQLVEMMGGEIDIASRPGAGSTFWFTARFATPGSAAATAARRSDLSGVRVLVVDHDPTTCTILQRYLIACGALSGAADTAQTALAMLRKAHAQGAAYDVALVDRKVRGMHAIELARRIDADSELRGTRIIVLDSPSGRETRGLTGEPGIFGHLDKPVRRAELFHSIAVAMGAAEPVRAAEQAMADTQEAPLGGHVLLVEDNSVNQEICAQMLVNLGCDVEVVSDGRAGLEAAFARPYDLVLMDCQMPVMDGLESATAIRERERAEAKTAPARHIPIIALTANAMDGDRARCIKAGMDDYLSKPFKKEALRAVLERWLPACPRTERRAAEPAAEIPPSVEVRGQAETLDRSALDNIRRLQKPGAPSVLGKVVDLYVRDAPRQITAMRDALSAGDSAVLRRAAHTLKSNSGNLGATGLAAVCKELETRAAGAALDGTDEFIERIQREYERVQAALLAETESAEA
ncbi:MAG TPA: MHYT domain-containing protein [Burkholderiales bacterium]|nr:MHYT domain-containing protein [Burkholderiales bacterium]